MKRKTLSFRDEVAETISVENWKEYNKLESYIDPEDDQCRCNCSIV